MADDAGAAGGRNGGATGRRAMALSADLNARLAAICAHPPRAALFVIGFAITHALLWACALTALKSAQDIHMDVAEAFQWGQRFLLGYGKHPPLSGWVAGIWFRIFPVADWAAYLLATTTLAAALVVNWLIAIRVTDGRRAMLAVLLLAIYPIFNIKGFKFNTDILQLLTLALVVLAFLHAFARRTLIAGLWLGLAGAAALMTKYWALLVIGAVGLSALAHPQRFTFLRSPAPWVAIVVFLAAMAPHLLWLKSVDFLPFAYADGVYHTTREWALRATGMYVSHNLAMLIPVIVVLAIALGLKPLPIGSRRRVVANADAMHVWVITLALAFVPVALAPLTSIYMKTDWGIPLFFLVPLALTIVPYLRVSRAASARALAVWAIFTIGMVVLAPVVARMEFRAKAQSQSIYGARSEMAQALTSLWRETFATRWAYVAATTEIGATAGFYSPDHPATLTPGEIWVSGLVDAADVRRSGFIGICAADDPERVKCEAWMAQNAPQAERRDIAMRRHVRGDAGPFTAWQIYLQSPQGARATASGRDSAALSQ